MNEFNYFRTLPDTTPELMRELISEEVDERTDNEVNIIPAKSISIASGITTLQPGGSLVLSLKTEPVIANAPSVVWESSNPEIAIVTSDGVVIGKKVGEVEISATNPLDNSMVSTFSLSISDVSEEITTENTPFISEEGQFIITEDTSDNIITEK